jgi:hypothetical protein
MAAMRAAGGDDEPHGAGHDGVRERIRVRAREWTRVNIDFVP